MRYLLAVLALSMLTACAGEDIFDRDRRLRAERAAAAAEARDAKLCQSYGYQTGTTAYAECRQLFELQRRQAADADRAATRAVVGQELLMRSRPAPIPCPPGGVGCLAR